MSLSPDPKKYYFYLFKHSAGCRSPPSVLVFLNQKPKWRIGKVKKINLRDYYPFYHSDLYIDVADHIVELFKQIGQKDNADFERRRVHKAYYSLDAYDGIERDIVLLVLSPEEIYERKMSNQELYAA